MNVLPMPKRSTKTASNTDELLPVKVRLFNKNPAVLSVGFVFLFMRIEPGCY